MVLTYEKKSMKSLLKKMELNNPLSTKMFKFMLDCVHCLPFRIGKPDTTM